jgi:O-antigen ligase
MDRKKIRLDNYVIGRTTYRRLRTVLLSAIAGWLVAAGRFVCRLRPVRWIGQRRAVRLTVGVGALLVALCGKYLWRPGQRVFRRACRYFVRREILAYVVAWAFCALLGFVIVNTWVTLPPMYLKVLVGGVILLAFALLCLVSPLAALFTYLLTAPLLKALIYIKLVEGLPMLSADTVCVGLLFLAYVFQPKKSAECQPTRLLHLFMCLFVLGQLLAALRTETPKASAQMVIDQYLLPILIYLYARRWVTNLKQLHVFFIILLAIGAYFIAFAIPEHFTGRNILSFTGYSSYIEYDLGVARAQGPAADPKEFGLVVALVAGIALTSFAHDKNKRNRALMLILTVLCLVGVAYTLRRSAYIGAVLVLLTMLGGSAKARRVAVCVLALGALGFMVNWASFKNSDVYSKRLGTVQPVYQRAVMHATAYNIFLHNPWLGMGFAKYGEGNRRYLVPYKNIMPWYGAGFETPHSSYWRILVDSGLVGFTPFMLMIVMFFVTSIRMLKRARAPGLLGRDGIVVCMGFALGVCAQAASTDSFFNHRYLIILWMLYFGALVGTHLRPQGADEPAGAVEVKPKLRSTKRLARA